MRWSDPIIDRTREDVDNALMTIATWREQFSEGLTPEVTELKGCLNVSDLLRIERNTEYIRDILDTLSFSVPVDTKTDWNMGSLPTVEDVNRIIDNIKEIRNKYYEPAGMPSLPQTMVSFSDINAIEQSLLLFREMLLGMVGAFRRTGTFVSGSPFRLPIHVGIWISFEDVKWGDIEGETWEGLAIYDLRFTMKGEE